MLNPLLESKNMINFPTSSSLNFLKPLINQELDQNSEDSQQQTQIQEGKWKDDQNIKFAIFIDFHCKIFASKQRRKSQKIFKILSEYLQTRTPAQCRSHYQKIMIKYKTLPKVRKYFKEHFGQDVYNESMKKFIQFWSQTHHQEVVQKEIRPKKQVKSACTQTQQDIFIPEQYYQMMIYWQHQYYLQQNNLFYKSQSNIF